MAAFSILRGHAWPGNLREIKNVLACALAFVDPDATLLDKRHLRLLSPANDATSWIEDLPLADQPLARIERAATRQTLSLAKGNKMAAAGSPPSTRR